MSDEILCCAGARLSGDALSGRLKGGGVWTLDLRHVQEARYTEWRGGLHVRHVLALRGPDGWREIVAEARLGEAPRSKALSEHHALSARVAEVLAEYRPGFRIVYEVRLMGHRLTIGLVLGLLLGLAGFLSLWTFLGGDLTDMPVLLSSVLVLSLIAVLAVRSGTRRRWPNVSAAALPGILTAVSRRG